MELNTLKTYVLKQHEYDHQREEVSVCRMAVQD
jgi:hypothetical protein